MSRFSDRALTYLTISAILTTAIFVSSCSSNPPKKGSLYSVLYWPSPPEPPRLKYLYSIKQPTDLNIGKSFWGKLKKIVLGTASYERIVKPYGILNDSGDGRIVVTDTGSGSIHVFDPENDRYIPFPKDIDEDIKMPIGIAVDSGGRLYVSDSELKIIKIFDKKGRRVASIDGGMERPTGIAINKEHGLLYVVDTLLNKVLIFNLEGKSVDSFGDRGIEDGEFNYPTGIFVDRKGNVYVVDSMNFRVQIFNKDGRFLSKFGRLGDGSGDFSSPKGVAVDSEGNIYVVDTLFDNVQIFKRDGTFLLAIGKQGNEPGEFWLPTGIFIDERDRVYVADSYNSRVQVFQFLGSTAGDILIKTKEK